LEFRNENNGAYVEGGKRREEEVMGEKEKE